MSLKETFFSSDIWHVLLANVCVFVRVRVRSRALWLWVFFTGGVVSHLQRQFMTLLCECFPLFCSVWQRGRQGDGGKVWYGPWGRESYRFHFFTAGLPGSVPLQQLLDCGLHSDALVHPRLICSRQRTACHSCLSNTSMEQTIAHTESCPRHTAPPHTPPPPPPPPPSPPPPPPLLLHLLLQLHSTMCFSPSNTKKQKQKTNKKNTKNVSPKLPSLHEMIMWSYWMYFVVVEMSVTHIYRDLIKSQLYFKLCIIL